MEEKYTINEVINFAVEIEKVGRIFYSKMAEKTDDQGLKNLYLKLMNDEIEHEKFYKELLDQAEKNEEFKYGLENEYVAYLHAFVEKSVFDEEKIINLVNSFKDTKEVLDYAIQKELDSVEYFTRMKGIVPDDNASLIARIIDEEKQHKQKLEEFKSKI